MLAAKGSCSTTRGGGEAEVKLCLRALFGFWRELRTRGGVGFGAETGGGGGGTVSVGVFDR